MASKYNSEFNYRYQVKGETVWEKIKTLKGFLEGREMARDSEQVSELRYQAKKAKLVHLLKNDGPEHEILELRADILEYEVMKKVQDDAMDLNKQEIEILNNVLAECYVIAEPSRIPGYTDEQMFEVNAANEFTAMIGLDIYSEILATGRPSPAKLRNAMSNPATWEALKTAGLVPQDAKMLLPNHNPLQIELVAKDAPPSSEQISS